MSKTLKYLPEGENFGDQHFTQSEAFRPTKAGRDYCAGGMAKRYAAGGRIKSRKAPPATPLPPADWGEGAADNMPQHRPLPLLKDSPVDPFKQDMTSDEMRNYDTLRSSPKHFEPDEARTMATNPSGRLGRMPANGGFAKGGKVKGYASGGAPMGALSQVAQPAPQAPMPAQEGMMQPGSPVHALARDLGHAAAKVVRKHLGKGKGPAGKARAQHLLASLRAANPRVADMAAPPAAAAPAAPMGMKDGGHFIQGMHLKKGALHRQMGVPEGQKIPAKKLAKAAHSDNPLLAKRARTAEMLKGLHHADGGHVHRYAEGGHVDGDEAEDRAMVTKGVHQHEHNMHAGKKPTALKLADGGPINQQPRDPRARTTRHGGTPGGEVPYGVQPSDESGNAPITTLRHGGNVRR